MPNKVAVVTGGSGGIGRCVCDALVSRGITVYELSRSGADRDAIRHISCDITDEAAVYSAANAVTQREHGVDILICNAGMGVSGAMEFTPAQYAHRQMDVNFFGAVNAVRAFCPSLRASKGRVVLISSVAALVPIPFQGFYSASKAAINVYSMALANELRPFGVSVCAIMPGDIRTGFTSARKKIIDGDDIYAGRIARSVAVMESDEKSGMQPQPAAERIAHLATKKRVKPLYALGFKYSLFCVLASILPHGLMNKIVYMLYGGA